MTACPDIQFADLTPADEFIVLACDGIWDVLSSQQAVDFIRQQLAAGLTPSSVCEALCDKCIAPSTTGSNGIGCDNMSAVLVVFKANLR